MADKVVPIRDLFASTLKPAPSKTVVPPPDDEKITSLDDPRLKSPFGEKKPAVSPNDEIIKLTEHKPLFGEQYQPKIKLLRMRQQRMMRLHQVYVFIRGLNRILTTS